MVARAIESQENSSEQLCRVQLCRVQLCRVQLCRVARRRTDSREGSFTISSLWKIKPLPTRLMRDIYVSEG